MIYLVYKDDELVGAFNEFNIFFIDSDVKLQFIKWFQEYGFDKAVNKLVESGYEVKEVLY